MNAAQRKFLVDRVSKKIDEKIEEIRKMKLDYPSKANYIFKAVMNGELALQSQAHILQAIKNKAMRAKEGSNWLSDDRMGHEKERMVKLLIEDLIVVPEDLGIEANRVINHNKDLDDQIAQLKIQKETLEVRIQLASNSVLAKLISEVDDMGDLSLIDTKLKLIG